MNNAHKKGLSLVEVMISMAILTMVFAGTVTLIITIVNLSFNTRLKTTAVALSQKGLADLIADFRANPNTYSALPYTSPAQTTGLPDGMISLQKTVTIPTGIPDSESGLTGSDNFVTVTSIVNWRPKGSSTNQTYEISQTIRKGYQ